MSDFIEWFSTVGKQLLRNPGEDLQPGKSQLQQTTIKSEFDNFVRQHYMIDTIDYLCMIATQQAYKNPSEREQFIDNRTTYEPTLSTDRIAVYSRGFAPFKILIIGIHGTKLTSFQDIAQDTRLVLGVIKDSSITTNYVNDVFNIVSQSNLPRDNIYICGHSLGAYYALVSGFVLKCNVRTFNGVNELITRSNIPNNIVFRNGLFSLEGLNNYIDATSYRMFGDPISLLNKWTIPNTITIKVDKMSINPVTLHSLDYMIEVCIPDIPLNKASLSQARRFNRLPLRNEMRTEGGNFQELREDADNSIFKNVFDVLRPKNNI